MAVQEKAVERKKLVVADLTERLKQTSAAYFVDYQGCDCAAISSLRRELNGLESKMEVVKNTLARRALEAADAPELGKLMLGPTAICMGKVSARGLCQGLS